LEALGPASWGNFFSVVQTVPQQQKEKTIEVIEKAICKVIAPVQHYQHHSSVLKRAAGVSSAVTS